MKSSEEPIDEALRNALKRKFDDFEVVPHPDMLDRVLGAINSTPFAGKVQKPVILILVLAIAFTSLLLMHYGTRIEEKQPGAVSLTAQEKLHDTKTQDKTDTYSINRKQELAGPIGENYAKKTSEKPVKNAGKELAEKPLKHHTSKKQAVSETGLSVISKKEKDISRVKIQISREDNAAPAWPEKNVISLKTTIPDKTEYAGKPETEQGILAKAVGNNQAVGQGSIENTIIPESSISLQELLPRPYHFAGYNSLPSVNPDAERPNFSDKPAKYYYLLSVTPINTFQKVTILPQMNIKYQNFILPTAVSAQTLGVKVDGGIEKNGFQFLVNFSRFSQVIHYEIATEEYNVEPVSKGDFTVIRKGIPVSERTNFNLLGVSVQKLIFFESPALRGYFGKAGVSVNHAFSPSQNSAWANVGLGKNWKLSRNTLLTVGPDISYSFTRLKTNNDAFRFHSYQLGLSVGLKFIKH